MSSEINGENPVFVRVKSRIFPSGAVFQLEGETGRETRPLESTVLFLGKYNVSPIDFKEHPEYLYGNHAQKLRLCLRLIGKGKRCQHDRCRKPDSYSHR